VSGVFDKVVSLVIFVSAYVLFVVFPTRRAVVAVTGAALLIISGVVSPLHAAKDLINWNVMGVFFGVLVLAELLMQSNMPAVVAERLVNWSPRAWIAMLLICGLSSFISMFAENVATVLLIAPIGLHTARKLNISPVPLLVGVAVCSNLQGTATLIGDPPSMIFAGYMRMTFTDFFICNGRLSIFFFVQAAAVASLAVLYLCFRRHRENVFVERQEKLHSTVPTALMVTLVAALVVASFLDKNFSYLSGLLCMGWAVAGLLWHSGRHGKALKLIRTFDWDTTFFLMGIFVLVGSLIETGWMALITEGIRSLTGGSVSTTFVVIVAMSVVVSGFVDNVPYLASMIPVAQDLARGLDMNPELFLFGLLIGGCIGGNITPIGASANVVTVGYLRRHGYHVTFGEFMRIGVPFTVVATAAAAAALWLVWG
jgi:Na+/H+ antiporter NhaD/arsenite permease-like protein